MPKKPTKHIKTRARVSKVPPHINKYLSQVGKLKGTATELECKPAQVEVPNEIR